MKGLRRIRFALFFLSALAAGAGLLSAQELPQKTDVQPAADPPKAPAVKAEATAKDAHHFWDQTNDWLFAGVAAARTLDYFSTLNMRRRGRQEILLSNDAVDNHAAFAAIEAAGTGTSIAASYLFHRYGHHTLERWVSIVHIGLATTGSVRNYCLKTFHSTSAPSNP